MGFLHKLWDETLAGPTPDNGLGKLRKYDSFSGRSSAPLVADDSMIISRSIMILKRSSSSNYRSFSGDSVPVSPAPGTPLSPGTPTTSPRGDFKKLTRRKKSATEHQHAEPRIRTVYDWIVISALDR